MYHNVLQNSEEPCPCCGKTWMELRAGKVTGSTLGRVMANYGKAFGDPAKRLALEIAVIELGGTVHSGDSYYNSHMERGNEEEPIARSLYEDETFTDVTNGGFFDGGKTGCSPDGLVYDNGLIEIKSAIKSVHGLRIKSGTYDPSYKWQLIFNLKQTGREWIDFVSFCSSFMPGKKLYVVRIFAEDVQDEFKRIDTRLCEFFEVVEKEKEWLRKAA